MSNSLNNEIISIELADVAQIIKKGAVKENKNKLIEPKQVGLLQNNITILEKLKMVNKKLSMTILTLWWFFTKVFDWIFWVKTQMLELVFIIYPSWNLRITFDIKVKGCFLKSLSSSRLSYNKELSDHLYQCVSKTVNIRGCFKLTQTYFAPVY